MARGDKDPRFVHEFELASTPQQARILGIRLNLARQLYNAFLGEAWARFRRCRRDPRWREARALSKAGQKREARALYAAVAQAPTRRGGKRPPKAPAPRRYSQEAEQLSLFPGMRDRGG